MTALHRLIRDPRLFWGGLFALTLALSLFAGDLAKDIGAKWVMKFPKPLELPLDKLISAAMKWLLEEAAIGPLSFHAVTRFISALIEAPYLAVRGLLVDGLQRGQGSYAVQILPPLSWIAVTTIFCLLAWRSGRRGLVGLVGACFLYLAVFGRWESAMATLASVLISVPMGVAGGVALGILAFRHPWAERAMRPVLDLMQTVPVFAYLVPILFMFGFGPTAALVATVIYAMPPMVRLTTLALREVPEEVAEAGRMAGCTRRQLLWKCLIPTAMPMLMVGVNQVIMLSLNMVIIASMIGAGGLGYDVLTALRKLDIGGGVEAGVAIVVMAIALDRLSQAEARRVPGTGRGGRLVWIGLAVILATSALGYVLPFVQTYPAGATLTTGTIWAQAIEWININLYDHIEAVKVAILIGLLLPVKGFFLGIPWAWGIVAMGLIGWRMAGWRLGLMALLMTGFIALTGFWPEAMITVYLCGVSVFVAMLIGVPLGIWAGQSDRANTVLSALIDTLQTLPSFVYLIPVVMLFRVGDFSAMIAVVAYSIVPAIRYAAHGIREIDPQMVEAGIVSGCTRRQILWRIKLPLALPSLIVGMNQTVMLALSMLVITALVGTRDLGQQVYMALTKANTGQGIVAGLCVAFIAIMVDRILTAAARGMERGEAGHG
ncbi:glycine betaine/proline transport system permease protein [Gemmobacter aquatilis]|uniref:Glycine betaine/proline transport system permease protein n=1 Tax=Gemmobacter aquatilis TaxID=933059 RepID=A0A1H8BN17_9RHOB|nr:ABC transporter permease subunit [Gemmobacter aquatilis]SEM83287.1 glycine betaine/proline transport system permease protein [Gemmobacter aquatilis]